MGYIILRLDRKLQRRFKFTFKYRTRSGSNKTG